MAGLTLPLTFAEWLESLKGGVKVKDLLHTYWIRNGYLFTLVNAEYRMHPADLMKFAHLQGVLDAYGAAEGGSFPDGFALTKPPEVIRGILDKMVEEWRNELDQEAEKRQGDVADGSGESVGN